MQCHNVDISITRVPGHAAAGGSQVLVCWPLQGAGLVVLSECKRKTDRGSSRGEVHPMWSGEPGLKQVSHRCAVRAGADDARLLCPAAISDELSNAPINSQSIA